MNLNTSYLWFFALLLLISGERIAQLIVAHRNLKWSRARGGLEYGERHYPFVVALHVCLLAGSAAEALLASRPFVPRLGFTMLALVLIANALRWWCIVSLAQRWNTRVVVVPGLAPSTTGPYHYLRHPNYVAIVIEGVALPLVHSAWMTAIGFTIAKLILLLTTRIPVENAALISAAKAKPTGNVTSP